MFQKHTPLWSLELNACSRSDPCELLGPFCCGRLATMGDLVAFVIPLSGWFLGLVVCGGCKDHKAPGGSTQGLRWVHWGGC